MKKILIAGALSLLPLSAVCADMNWFIGAGGGGSDWL